MTTLNIAYADSVAIAITSADALADGSWCSSALVDNAAANLYDDALWNGSLQTGTVPAGGGYIDLYLAASADGVEFTAGASGGDAAITWGTTPSTSHIGGEFNLRFVDSIFVAAGDDNKDIVFGPYPVAEYFGSVMPAEWKVIVENNTNAALHSTGTNNHLEYRGVTFTNT